MTHETISALVATGGLLFMVVAFIVVLIYALWPGNKDKFKAAARAPLEED